MQGIKQKIFMCCCAWLFAAQLQGQEIGRSQPSDAYLLNRANAALTRARLSHERSKIALLRIYAEHAYLFEKKDSLCAGIPQLASITGTPASADAQANSFHSIDKQIFNYWKEVSSMERLCVALKKNLKLQMPAPIAIPSFALEVIKKLEAPPANDADALLHVRYAEEGAFFTEQCAQLIEVVAEQFITNAYLKKKQAMN